MEPDLASSPWVDIPGRQAAHLAGEAVSIEDLSPQLRRNTAFKLNGVFGRFLCQEVLPRLQIRNIMVCEDLPAFLLPQFAHASRPLADASASCIANLDGGNYFTDVGSKEFPDSLF